MDTHDVKPFAQRTRAMSDEDLAAKKVSLTLVASIEARLNRNTGEEHMFSYETARLFFIRIRS